MPLLNLETFQSYKTKLGSVHVSAKISPSKDRIRIRIPNFGPAVISSLILGRGKAGNVVIVIDSTEI